jgi:hypothetical protein
MINEVLQVEVCTYRYVFLLFCIVVSIIFAVSDANFPPLHYSDSFGKAWHSISPLMYGLALSFYFFRYRYEGAIQGLNSLLLGFLFVAVVVLGTWGGTTRWGNLLTTNLLYLFLGVLLLCVAGAIVLQIVRLFNGGATITSENTWENLILQIILFLPCMVEDFAKYIGDQFQMASAPLIILLVIELALILLFFFAPTLLQGLVKNGKTLILPGALSLSTSTTLADSHAFVNDVVDMTKTQDTSVLPNYMARQNYSFSLWLYLNKYDSTLGKQERQIFNYGSAPFQGKPCLYAQGGQVYVSLSDSSPQQSRIPLDIAPQKWNQIVVSYRYEQIDVFVNASLVDTVQWGSYKPTYSTNDVLTVGDGRGGLLGAICNISYSHRPLTQMEISTSYNFLRFLNPPVIPGVSSSENKAAIEANSKQGSAPGTAFPFSVINGIQDAIHAMFPSFVVSDSSPKQRMPLNNSAPQFAGYGAAHQSYTTDSSS